jgi:TolB-like protein
MDRAQAQSFEFGAFRFSEQRKELSRDGAVVPLGSRALDVLACLLRHAGETVGKDALMADVWPDRMVEEHNLAVHLSALRRALNDGNTDRSVIHTDPGRGYRFVAPVRRIADMIAPVLDTRPGSLASPADLQRKKPSIAALPFDDMSADAAQAYFSDGMVEDIITELSRSRSLFVVARSSSFTYRGKNLDIRQVAAELGVRYVLEGSVRHNAARVRVNAQLIEAETGGHIWAERYDRDINDMFAVQDDITRSVVMAIEPAVLDAEQIHANRVLPENLGAWEAFHRGMWFLEQVDPVSNTKAREFFERAIALDPGFAPPHAWLVQTWLNERHVFFTHGSVNAAEPAKRAAQRAVTLDPNDAAGHAALAWAFYMSGDPAAGVTLARRALTLNPNHVDGHRALAQNLVWLDDLGESRDVLLSCLRLCPRGSRNWLTLHQLTAIHYLTHEYEEAAAAGLRVLDARPLAVPHRWLIAALGQLGRVAEAQEVMRSAAEIVGMPFDEYASLKAASVSDRYHAHMLEGLRLAGWKG